MNTVSEMAQERNTLLAKQKTHELEILSEAQKIKEQSIKVGKYTLMAAGVAVVGYAVFRFVFLMLEGESEEENSGIHTAPNVPVKVAAQEDTPMVVKMIWNAIAAFLLSIAKQKLIEFIEKLQTNATDETPKAVS